MWYLNLSSLAATQMLRGSFWIPRVWDVVGTRASRAVRLRANCVWLVLRGPFPDSDIILYCIILNCIMLYSVILYYVVLYCSRSGACSVYIRCFACPP